MPRRTLIAQLIGQLWFQVLVATVAGIALGWWRPALGTELKPLGDAFIAVIRMLIAPVIFCTVVHGIAAMNDMRRVGRVALKAIVYFEAMTGVALVLALVAVDLWRPGSGMHIDPATLDASAVAAPAGHGGGWDLLLSIIPTSFGAAFVQGNVLQMLLVSVLFAAALGLAGERGRPVFDLIGRLNEIFFRMVGVVMWVAPLGAFGSIAFTVGKFGAGSLVSLANLLVEFYAVSLVFVFLVLGLVARAAGFSLIKLLARIRDEIVVVAATTSTETVLPRLMQRLEDLGCDETVVGLVVPTGYSFNLDGTCLYLATAAVFLAQATDTKLDLPSQLGLLAVLLLSSKGAAGVAGAAIVVLGATLASVGTIPLASVALILGIHRLMAEALTFVNLVGNAVATIVVCKWEGAFDRAVMERQIGR